MKIYVISARCDTELEPARVFKTREEAERDAHNYIYSGAREDYRWRFRNVDNPSDEELEKWAEDNGYELWDYYWWNGGDETLEAEITEVDI